MPLFICEQCQTIENTATGRWWTRNSRNMWSKDNEGKALCSVCAPPKYVDGTRTEFGVWHDKFPRRRATEADLPHVSNPKVFRPPEGSEPSSPQ